MGQQQLLITILVTIIIGIATIVAINTFSNASEAANVDAVRQDLLTISSLAQIYIKKPAMLGGASNFYDFTFHRVSFNADSIEENQGLVAINQNGVYQVSGRGNGLEITAHPSSRIPGNLSFNSEATDSEGPLVLTIYAERIEWEDTN